MQLESTQFIVSVHQKLLACLVNMTLLKLLSLESTTN
jgi:hypothetical protein